VVTLKYLSKYIQNVYEYNQGYKKGTWTLISTIFQLFCDTALSTIFQLHEYRDKSVDCTEETGTFCKSMKILFP
jgi:hypothetical protein